MRPVSQASQAGTHNSGGGGGGEKGKGVLWWLAQPILLVVGQGSGSYCVDCPRALDQLAMVHTVFLQHDNHADHTSTRGSALSTVPTVTSAPTAAPGPAPAQLQRFCHGPTGSRAHGRRSRHVSLPPRQPGGEAINARPNLPFQGRRAEPLLQYPYCRLPGTYCEATVVRYLGMLR